MSEVKNVYSKSLTKKEIFTVTQNADHILEVIDTPIKVLGLHFKEAVSAEGEVKKLVFILTKDDYEKDAPLKSYFSSAASLRNTCVDIGDVFQEDIENGSLTVEISQVQTQNKNTIYVVNIQ